MSNFRSPYWKADFSKNKTKKNSDPRVTNSENSPLLPPFCQHCPVFLRAMESTSVPVYLTCLSFSLKAEAQCRKSIVIFDARNRTPQGDNSHLMVGRLHAGAEHRNRWVLSGMT